MLPAEFKAYHEPALEADEVEHGLILNALARTASDKSVRRLKSSVAVTGVYTPPELRGRGYAGSVTAAVVARIYAEGRKIACLYTDLRNPASNRCYTKIGFAPVCGSLHFYRNV